MDGNNQITQWEYKKFVGKSFSEEELNKLGEQGWELTGSTSAGPILFKRPKITQKHEQNPSDYGYSR